MDWLSNWLRAWFAHLEHHVGCLGLAMVVVIALEALDELISQPCQEYADEKQYLRNMLCILMVGAYSAWRRRRGVGVSNVFSILLCSW